MKKRPDMVSPGISDPADYIPISTAIETIDQKAMQVNPDLKIEHVINTGNAESTGDTVSAQNVRLEKNSGIDFPKFSEVTTTAPLLVEHLDKLDNLYVRKNSSYKLVYRFTPTHLKIYKLTPEEQITNYEKPIVEKSPEGLLVPVGAYEISYFQEYKVPDADNRPTNVIDYKAVSSENFKKLATHMTYNPKGFIPFVKEEKTNVFPADYFNGEWYFATAVVATKPGDESSIGYFDSASDSSLRKKATRIKFLRNREFLRAVNTVVDSRAKVTDDQLDDVMNIPANWLDYKLDQVGGELGLEETLDTSTDYKERPYVKLELVLTKTLAEANDSSRVDAYFKGLELSDINFTKDSFSFTILKVSNSIKRKYSFMRVPAKNLYEPKVYSLDDQKTYGYFKTTRDRYFDIGLHRRSDIENNFLVNRFNPDKPIVFRFSKQTPKTGDVDINGIKIDYRKIGRNAVSYWNRVFKIIGSEHGIVLDESDENELGDFSTNTINLISNLSADGSGGVGPTIDDPLTGEIINGTVNVYTATTLATTIEGLRNVLKVERGLIKDTVFSAEIRKRGIQAGFRKEVSYFCPEVTQYAKTTSQALLLDSENENKILYACLEKIVPKRVEAITVHEMGHTLGLLHNFYGSFDAENSFKAVADLEAVYPKGMFPDLYEQNIPKDSSGNHLDEFVLRYTSVMDYFKVWFGPSDGVSLPVPGSYDIAALAYLYFNKLPVKSPGNPLGVEFKKIIDDKDAAAQLADNGYIRHMYCKDNEALGRAHLFNREPIDSGCALHDKGQTYTELLDNYFNRLRDDLLIYSEKLDRFSLRSATQSVQGNIGAISIVYQDWRYKLSAFMPDPSNTRLKGYTEESFNQLLSAVERSDDKLALDKNLSQKYFQYMSEIADIPNYYCVVKTKTNEVKIYEFEELQKRYINMTEDKTMVDCENNILQKTFSDNEEVYLTSIGMPISPIQYSQKPEDSSESFDVMGVGAIRATAVTLMGALPPLLYFTKLNGFQPSVLDEPAVYKQYKGKVQDRILHGLKLSDQLNYAFELKGVDLVVSEDKVFNKFMSENVIYDKAFVTLVNSNVGTDSSGPKRENLDDFRIGKTQNKADVPAASTSVRIGNIYYYASLESSWGTDLIKRYRALRTPSDVDLSLIAPSLAESFGVLVNTVEALPVKVDVNYVLKQDEVFGLIQNFSIAQREAAQNPALTAELGLAFQSYMGGFQNTAALFQAEQVINTTGQSEFNNILGREVVQASEIIGLNSVLREKGMDSDLSSRLGFEGELSQMAILGNYLRSKNTNAYNYWSIKAGENLEDVKSFEESEFTVYKSYLESRIAQ
ncbi:MAG: zinc-dependent metalloprotease [Bdellovibrionales bacterium]